MKDFKSYRAERAEENEAGRSDRIEESAAEELTRRALAAYDGKSSVVVLADILSRAERAKRNGQLTNEEIDDFYRQFSPLLEEKQRKMLKNVTDRLKEL